MIIAFVGTPGSGKTYDAVKKVLDNLRLGKKVYTNIEGLNNDKCLEFIKTYTGLDDYQIGTQLVHTPDKEMLHIWEFVEDKSIVVIDEVHRLFSNRDWSTDKNKYFTEWASIHRHHGLDIILVTQDIEKVDKHARSLIEWSFFYRKVNFFGSLVSNKYLRYTYSCDDHNGQPLSKDMLSYDHRIFQCYKSYAADDIKEFGIMKGVNVLRHPVFYAIPVVFAAVLWMGSKSSLRTGDIFGTKKATATSMAKIKKASPSTQSTSNHQDPLCSSYKIMLPDGVTGLVSELPPGAKILKCFGSKRNSTTGREG